MSKPINASRSLYSLIAAGLGMLSLTANLRVFTSRRRMILYGTGIGIGGIDSGIDAIHDPLDEFDLAFRVLFTGNLTGENRTDDPFRETVLAAASVAGRTVSDVTAATPDQLKLDDAIRAL